MLLLPFVVLWAQDEEITWEEEDDDFLIFGRYLSFRVGGYSSSTSAGVADDADYYDYKVMGYSNFSAGLEMGFYLTSRLMLSGGIDFCYRKMDTEHWDNDWLGDYVRKTRLDFVLIPMTLTLKFFPLGSHNSYGNRPPVSPWIGAGVGMYIIAEGNDFGNHDYWDDYGYDDYWYDDSSDRQNDVNAGYHFAGGLLIPINRSMDIGIELRYTKAEGVPYYSYYSSDPIDIGGLNVFVSFGMSY
jgi:hypothetical protein